MTVGGSFFDTVPHFISQGGIFMETKKRILTGERPTGKLHLGHYVGSLQNRLQLQQQYETFIIIADVQALTTNFETPERLKNDVLDVALDNLAVGIDPEISTLFIQSMIPQIAELTIFYSMFITVNLLRHNPTIKTEAAQHGYKDMTYGFLGYPVSQAADITFCKAHLVPAGDDQIPHIELARKIVRRFNTLYKPIFVEPEVLLGSCPRLIGIDGNAKMSKSMNNAIFLSDTTEEIQAKVNRSLTDKNRISIHDPGNPDLCVVYRYHQIFNPNESSNIRNMCQHATIGCVACKRHLAITLDQFLTPIRERRRQYEENLPRVRDILLTGTEKARSIAAETMAEVREAMAISYPDFS